MRRAGLYMAVFDKQKHRIDPWMLMGCCAKHSHQELHPSVYPDRIGVSYCLVGLVRVGTLFDDVEDQPNP